MPVSVSSLVDVHLQAYLWSNEKIPRPAKRPIISEDPTFDNATHAMVRDHRRVISLSGSIRRLLYNIFFAETQMYLSTVPYRSICNNNEALCTV